MLSLNLDIIAASEEDAQGERGIIGTLNIYHIVSVGAENYIAYILFVNNPLWPFLFYVIEMYTSLAGLLSFNIHFLTLKQKAFYCFHESNLCKRRK